ncbi:MAG TPA: bifunctional ornithine acetyltransferase/N-acetylglutamate synthase, partial [Polymorphobacter sp.]|nr:bifunctional ornithine acetyltransferase/N-acetylglutamate synthase [Polymorphobacter sp.]
MTISPLAQPFPAMPPVAGVRLAVARAGYKAWDRADLTLAELAPGTSVAGVLTRSKCPSPEVDWCRSALLQGRARVLVVNAGNSNAFTGKAGEAAVQAVVSAAITAFDCPPAQVFVASTGVIGVPLPAAKA